jgi:hypothetical protein
MANRLSVEQIRLQADQRLARQLVGRNIDNAIVIAQTFGMRTRTFSTDGHRHAVTDDVCPSRVNFAVVRDIVTRAWFG